MEHVGGLDRERVGVLRVELRHIDGMKQLVTRILHRKEPCGDPVCDAKMLREECFKKYIQAPLIGMRIWFGLILKITERTKSYILAELHYLIK